MTTMSKGKIIVGLSGGVDSSVAALLLMQSELLPAGPVYNCLHAATLRGGAADAPGC